MPGDCGRRELRTAPLALCPSLHVVSVECVINHHLFVDHRAEFAQEKVAK